MPFRSIRRKFLVSLVAATSFFALAMIVFAETVIRRMLVTHLQEKGLAIARTVAADSVNPIITEHYFEVAMAFHDLREAEEDVLYAFVLDENGRELVHTFAGGLSTELKGAQPRRAANGTRTIELQTDRGPVLDISVPLLHGQIGWLRLGLSTARIRHQVNGIVLLIVLFAAATFAVGVAAAVGFARVITRPLLSLTRAAEAFGRGDTSQPVVIDSQDEVGKLAGVFNAMVASRLSVEEEREVLIEELRRTLGEVKTLRGFLPICSSCKKIRSDQGYWQQIESYIRDHSQAEFSHGLCPDCARTLYPEILGPGGGSHGT
ncbi:MAG: HAMP domain-containing protein [Deltaproteobacteria bacterium]|nr:HAMP domain-containing protein [Deltaproteobacteria bacterium]